MIIMKIIETIINGVCIIETQVFNDQRGSFQKILNYNIFKSLNLDTNFKEYYFSISKKDVIRGLHFQIPPFEHTKLVNVSFGSILDVIVDLRKSSSSFGKLLSFELNSHSGRFLYLPSGIAHGFKSLEDNTIVNYTQTSCYSKEHDNGILFSSIDFDGKTTKPLVSERDLFFPTLKEFIKRTPFL